MNVEQNLMEVFVPGMSCGHCEASVKAELGKIEGVFSVAVDLASKRVVIAGTADRDAVAAAIDEAGFAVVETAL